MHKQDIRNQKHDGSPPNGLLRTTNSVVKMFGNESPADSILHPSIVDPM